MWSYVFLIATRQIISGKTRFFWEGGGWRRQKAFLTRQNKKLAENDWLLPFFPLLSGALNIKQHREWTFQSRVEGKVGGRASDWRKIPPYLPPPLGSTTGDNGKCPGGPLEYKCCTHAWPEIFKTYPKRDFPSPGKTPPKPEFRAILLSNLPLNKLFLGEIFDEV